MLFVFDVNETLLDVAALDEFFEERVGSSAARAEWFAALIHSALTLTAVGGYEQFGSLAATAFEQVAERHHRKTGPDDRAELGRRIASLPAHPDVVNALQLLRDHGATAVTLTNSTAAVAEQQLNASGLRSLVAAVHSADTAGQLKPGRAPYKLVEREHGISAEQAVLVAAHDWDLAGAAAAGWRTAFIDRGQPWRVSSSVTPTYQADNLRALVEQILNANEQP